MEFLEGLRLTGSTGGFWPKSNLNVKKVGKREGRRSWPPLPIIPLPLLLSHQWGILATLIQVVHSYFNPEPALWRKRVGAWWRCWWWAGGKSRSVIVARLQSRQLTMLSSEIPQNLTTLEYHQTVSGCLWNTTDTVWRCNLQALKSAPMLLK